MIESSEFRLDLSFSKSSDVVTYAVTLESLEAARRDYLDLIRD